MSDIEREDEEDVLYQGDFYDEGNTSSSARKRSSDKGSDKSDESGNLDWIDKGDAEQKKFDLSGLLGNKKAILFGIVAVLILIVVLSVASSSASKKAEDAEQARLEALLEESEEAFYYTYVELEELRVAGYTGDEIEEYEAEGIPAEDLISAAELARQDLYESEVAPYFDNASEEFLELYNHTWVGQADLNYDTDTSQYQYYESTVNVDYTKLPARGHQLFIEYYLSSGDACWMTVTPERYLELADTGNIVLRVQYTKTGDGSVIITDVEEIIP